METCCKTDTPTHQGRIQGIGMGGPKLSVREILLINIQNRSILLPKRALNRVLAQKCYSLRVRYMHASESFCSARPLVVSVESSITGVATNNYSMNLIILLREGGNWPLIPPLDLPLLHTVTRAVQYTLLVAY